MVQIFVAFSQNILNLLATSKLNTMNMITFRESVILSPDSVTPPSLPTSAGSMTSKSSFSRVRKLLTLGIAGINNNLMACQIYIMCKKSNVSAEVR